MLPKRFRLDLRREKPFYTFSGKYQDRLIRLYWRKEGNQKHPQAAVIISKKVAPTAVQRNYIKRVLRALLSSLLPSFSAELCIVIVIKDQHIQSHLSQLEETLRKKFDNV
jgi:ribonuclease P protein component